MGLWGMGDLWWRWVAIFWCKCPVFSFTKFCTSISPTVDIQTTDEVDICAKIIPKNHTQTPNVSWCLDVYIWVSGWVRDRKWSCVSWFISCLRGHQQPTSIGPIGVNLFAKYQQDMPDSGREYPLCLKLISWSVPTIWFVAGSDGDFNHSNVITSNGEHQRLFLDFFWVNQLLLWGD